MHTDLNYQNDILEYYYQITNFVKTLLTKVAKNHSF